MKKWGAAEELSSAAFCIFSLSFENRPTNKNNNDIAMIKPLHIIRLSFEPRVDVILREAFLFGGTMAESKKREFNRAIAQKRCLEAVDRAILINEGKAERPFLYTVNELVVFGSLVNSDRPKVHDVDLFVTWKQKLNFQDDYKAADKAWQDYTRKYAPDSLRNDWYKVQSFPQTDVQRYLRGRGSGLISLHGELDRFAIDGGENYAVILDGKVQEDALDALKRKFGVM